MQASSIGGNRIIVNRLDGIDVNFNGMFNTLVIRNQSCQRRCSGHHRRTFRCVSVANMESVPPGARRPGSADGHRAGSAPPSPARWRFCPSCGRHHALTYYDKEEDDDSSGFDGKEIFDRTWSRGKPFWRDRAGDGYGRAPKVAARERIRPAKMLITWQAMADAADSYRQAQERQRPEWARQHERMAILPAG